MRAITGEEPENGSWEVLDTNHDGNLTAGEKRNARIIIYGHSWGGSEAINLARELEKDGIPVLLTVQVDSISIRHNDRVIPANVAQAANFYQPHGLLHGQSAIRAADPSRTRIIGNFRSDYKASDYNCEHYPWYDRVFVKAHTQIECDADGVEACGGPHPVGPGANHGRQDRTVKPTYLRMAIAFRKRGLAWTFSEPWTTSGSFKALSS